MRSTASFTIHAILAACLAAFAASSAAAQSQRAPTLRIVTETPANSAPGNIGSGRAEQLEIQSWQWTGVSKIDSFTIKQGIKPMATGENVQGSQDIVITGSRIPQPNLVAKGAIVGDSAGAGTLRVKVKMPWLACEEGRKYPSLELNDGGQRILIEDAVVTSCGKVGVRGWDPKEKKAVTGEAEPG